LQGFLSGDLEGTTPDQISEILRPRLKQLANFANPFGTPNDTSKKKVESGSVTLRDKVVLALEDGDKEFVFAVSDALSIDQVDALVLLRSFLYNRGLPANAGAGDSSLIEELVEAITPFYYSERLALLRTFVPLLHAREEPTSLAHEIAIEALPIVIPDGRAFAGALLDEYLCKVKAGPPERAAANPKAAARWAKQNAREQLIVLEVLFWTMFGYVPCDGALVVRIYETAYAVELGSLQENNAMMLDAEGAQLQQDSAAVWILIMLEVLELERVAEPGGIEIAVDPAEDALYTASPASLTRLHELITTHANSHHACVYMAWAFVLSRLVAVKSQLKTLPPAYHEFFRSLPPQGDRSYVIDADSVHRAMAKRCLEPEVGLFPLMLTLLTASPVFVPSVAWKTGSTVTEPNAVAFRSVFKGEQCLHISARTS
jgi:nuclear pore complex protein Nup188